jgi:hypothetical protein
MGSPTHALSNFAGRLLGSIRVGRRGGSVGVGYGKKPSPWESGLSVGSGYGTHRGQEGPNMGISDTNR